MSKTIFYENYLTKKVIFLIVACLMLIVILDVSIIKLYDLSSKENVTSTDKKFGFFAIVVVSLFLQLLLLRYAGRVGKRDSKDTIKFRFLNRVPTFSYCFLIFLISLVIFQLFYLNYYDSLILMLIVLTTYGTAAYFVGKTSTLFLSWYRRSHDFAILVYFMSISLIVFNLILTAIVVDIYLANRPEKIREFIGGSMDLSAGRYSSLSLLLKISSVLSFLSIWMATVVLSYSSRDELIKKLRYLTMPILLLVYFLISYFSQDIFIAIFTPFLRYDPILFSSSLLMFFTLIKPVGGIIFGIAFWKMSKTVSYEKTLEKFLIITGYGFLLLFSANQSTSLVLAPYPPYGISTISILIIGAYLVMIGIYTSATLVSKSSFLRKSIYKIAKESKLLEHIGKAEMEKEVNNTVTKILRDVEMSEVKVQSELGLDQQELRSYLVEVVDELRKKKVG